MKTKLFPVLMLLLALFSCNEDDLSPEAKVQGAFENIYQSNQAWSDDLFEYVDRIELKSDGSFYMEDVTKNLDTEDVLGYRRYGHGTFTISEGIVTLHYEDSYIMGIEDINYLPKDQLVVFEGEMISEQFTVLENYTQLEYRCPSNAFCGTLPIYEKID
jgi:hypothetical protein